MDLQVVSSRRQKRFLTVAALITRKSLHIANIFHLARSGAKAMEIPIHHRCEDKWRPIRFPKLGRSVVISLSYYQSWIPMHVPPVCHKTPSAPSPYSSVLDSLAFGPDMDNSVVRFANLRPGMTRLIRSNLFQRPQSNL